MLLVTGIVFSTAFSFWVYCIIDVIRTEPDHVHQLPKLLWLIVTFFLPVIGSLLWLAFGQSRPLAFRVLRRAQRMAGAPSGSLVIGSSSRGVRFERYLRDMWTSRGLTRVLASRSLKGMYEMNVVGFAWWILEPLSMSLMYYFIFTHIFDRSRPVVSLLAAVLPYKWFSQSLVQAMGTVRGNAQLLDVYFPRSLLPIADTLVGLAHFSVGLLVMPAFMVVYGKWGGIHILWLPLIAAVQLVFTLGLAYPLSVWGISARNLPGVVNNLLRLWFYLSPGVWTLEFIQDRSDLFKTIVRLNPLTGLFEAYRRAFVEGRPPSIDFAWTTIVAAGLFSVGLYYFSRRERQFAKML